MPNVKVRRKLTLPLGDGYIVSLLEFTDGHMEAKVTRE